MKKDGKVVTLGVRDRNWGILVEAVAENPSNITVICQRLKDSTSIARLLVEAIELQKRRNINNNSKIYEQTVNMTEDIKVKLLENYPLAIKYYKENQTYEMCKAAIKAAINCWPSDVTTVFKELQHQDAEIVEMAVSNGSGCYKYVTDTFKTEKVKRLAIKFSPTELSNIDGPHSEELVELAVREWPKAIRWAKCDNLDKMQILALELNMQAMEAIDRERVSKDVIDRFKELCIEDNYFDEYWCPKFDLTQEQLYNMYTARYDWIESYNIFLMLDTEHKIEAVRNGMTKAVKHLSYEGVMELGLEDIKVLIGNLENSVKTGVINGLDEESVVEILGEDGMMLRFVENQTEKECLVALRNDAGALKYVNCWTPRVMEYADTIIDTATDITEVL